MKVDLNARRVAAAYQAPELKHDSPWQELYRRYVGQLGRVPGFRSGVSRSAQDGPAAFALTVMTYPCRPLSRGSEQYRDRKGAVVIS